jgi:hypothetical protein
VCVLYSRVQCVSGDVDAPALSAAVYDHTDDARVDVSLPDADLVSPAERYAKPKVRRCHVFASIQIWRESCMLVTMTTRARTQTVVEFALSVISDERQWQPRSFKHDDFALVGAFLRLLHTCVRCGECLWCLVCSV